MSESRKIDLNLLMVLRALLMERNLARAADVLGMKQSSVRTALARLQRLFDDPLLLEGPDSPPERRSRGFVLTQRAEDMLPLVEYAAEEALRMFDGQPTFDPAVSTRTFLVWASDYALSELASPLTSIFAREAPYADIEFDALPAAGVFSPEDLLRRDVTIFASGRNMPGKHMSLFSDRFVCLADANNSALCGRTLSIDAIASTRLVQPVFAWQLPNHVDDMLAGADIAPKIALTVRSLLAMPFAIAGTPWIGWVPERIANRFAPQLGLIVAETPISPSVLVEAAYWHPSRTSDPARRWLVQKLREASEVVEFGTDVNQFDGRMKLVR